MRLPILITIALGACAPQADAPSPQPGDARQEPVAVPDAPDAAPSADAPAPDAPGATPTGRPGTAIDAPSTLAGEWRVAGIDGREFDEPYGIALSASDTEIWWSPRCAGQSVSYRIEGARFVDTSPPRQPGAVVCEIGLPPRLPEVMNAIRAAETIERTPANGIRLSGGGRSLTLFTQ